MPVLKAIRDLFTGHNAGGPANIALAQAVSNYYIFFNRRAVELMDQLAEAEEARLTKKKKHETELARLNDLSSQRGILQRKTADRLEHA